MAPAMLMAGTTLLDWFSKGRALSKSVLLSGLILVLARNAGAQVVAEFSADTTSGCVALTVTFTDQSTGSPNIWSWDFGDGGTSNQQNPSHMYVDANTYTVTLTVEDGVTQDTETKTSLITVLTPVTAAFGSDETSGCGPLTVNFTDQSSGDEVSSWDWDFGDDNSSTQQNPNHTYQNPGTYTVTLTAGNGCSSDDEVKPAFITVTNSVSAAFVGDPLNGCPSLSVAFTDLSQGDGVNDWDWDFGDDNSSTQQNPNHTYQNPGTYTVALTARNDCSSDVETKSNYITVGTPPTADFNRSPASVCIGDSVSFTDTSTGDVNSWSWDFGDGGSSTQQNPADHTYQSVGAFTVRLTVTGACGQDSRTRTVTVVGSTVANFTADEESGCTPHRVRFTDASTGSGLDSWSWDFGDNASSSQQNPAHTYNNAGTYTVSLTASGDCGQGSVTKTNFITVADSGVADFQASPTSGCPGVRVNFTDDSTGSGLGPRSWDFGDSTPAGNGQNPNHVYTAAGTYTVTLTVAAQCGALVETKTDLITVLEPTAANFSASETSGCAPLTVDFSDTSTGANLTFRSWAFGDPASGPQNSSTQQNPSHTYDTAGMYTVRLTVGGTCGQDSVTKTITVAEPGVADFRASTINGCAPLVVSFTNLSTGTFQGTYNWDFGDGNSSNQKDPTHPYTTAGLFFVTLRFTADCGGPLEKKVLITVLEPTDADFDASETSGCAPLAVDFSDTSTGANITFRSWAFGDGTSSNQQNPQHTYQNAGTYSATLTVSGTCGQDSVTKLIEVADDPVAPLSIQYRASGVFLDENLDISWPAAERAAEYVVEARVDGSDWSEVCTVQDDPGIAQPSCSVELDERGTWAFRVFSRNDCGDSSPVTGPDISVVPRPIFAYWPLDCADVVVVTDVENGNDGRVTGGNVPCDEDRFGRDRRARRFEGEGYVRGSSLRPWDDAFSLTLWTRPEAAPAGEGGESTVFEIFADDANVSPQTETLSIVCNSEELSLTVKRGPVEMFRFTNVAAAWHHVLVTRTGQTVQAYLDGVPAPPVTHGFHLGDGFSMGAAGDGSARFRGHLDEVRYESGGRDRGQVVDLLLEQDGSVYLDPTVQAQEFSLPPGGMVEAMALRLHTGEPRRTRFRIEDLKLRLVDVTPPDPVLGGAGIGDDEEFSYLEAITLFSQSRCDGIEIELEEVGTFEIQPVAPGTADLELTLTGGSPFLIPSNADSCFSVEVAVSAVALTRNRVLQFGLESTDDLVVLDGSRETFVAGNRKAEGLSVPGNEIHVVNTPPELFVTVQPSSQQTIIENAPLLGALLHNVLLEAGSTESISLRSVIYTQLQASTLVDVTNVALSVEQDGESRLVGEGVVDVPAGVIRFTNLNVEIPASTDAEFFVHADIHIDAESSADPPNDSGAGMLGWPSPESLPPGLLAVLLIGISLTLLSRLRPKNTLRLARLATLWLLGGLLSLGAGCGPLIIGGVIAGLAAGGGGGGGGGGGAPVTLVQVGIKDGDLDVRGGTSNAPAMLNLMNGDAELRGPLIQVRRP